MNKYSKKYIPLMFLTFIVMAFGSSSLGDSVGDNIAIEKQLHEGYYSAGFSSFFNVNWRPGENSSHKNLFQKSNADTPIIILLLVSLIIIITQIIRRARSYYIARIISLKEENVGLKKEIEDKKIESRKLFAYLNHELKNALNSVQSASSLMFEHFDSLDDDERDTLRNTITKSTGLIGRFFDSLSTWSQNGVDIEKKKPEEFEILPIVVEELNKHDQAISDKNLSVELKIRDTHTAYMDVEMFHIISNTAISNGIKYSHTGGKVIISSEEIGDKTIFSVKDFGIGITEENLAKLFDLKTIFNTNGPEGEKGTGLSLLISKIYLEASNGELSIESVENEGSIISIILPKKESFV